MEPKTDAEIYVQGSCFCVCKELLSSKSNYLKRLFKESSQITISPPLNITAKTFDLVVDYCYNGSVVISPVNVAALRIAAELLEMSNVENGASTGDNLWQKTEDYFQRAIDVNKNYVVIILRSCLSHMPEAEIAANLVSRCIEALALALAADEENNMVNYLQDIKTVHYKDFRLIAESLYNKLTGTAGQDLLYQIIDFYFKECTGNITDDEKMGICNYIDCNILSPQQLTHVVLNPRLPLGFVFQVLYKNPGTIISVTNNDMKTRCESPDAHTTLGALLQRDSALHQVAQLQSAMDATSWRIQSLEKELLVMRQVVQDNIEVKGNKSNLGKSSSCRQNLEKKVERGQRGSISSSFIRTTANKVSNETQILGDDHNSTTKIEQKNFGRKLMNGLKNAFGVGTSNKKNSGASKVHEGIKKIY